MRCPVSRSAALLTWALVSLAGCGSAHSDAPEETELPRAGTPARAVVSWWKQVGEGDTRAIVAGLTPSARQNVSLDAVKEALAGGLDRFARASAPMVLYSEGARDGVTVFTKLESGALLGSKLIKRGQLMLALPLVRSDRRWLIDNSAWLRTQLAAYSAAELKRREQAAEATP